MYEHCDISSRHGCDGECMSIVIFISRHGGDGEGMSIVSM